MKRITLMPQRAGFGFAFICLLAAGCTEPPETYQGYMEGQFSYLSAPYSGNLKALFGARGQRVAAGTAVFEIDSPDLEQAAKRQYHQWQSALSVLDDLEKGRRPSEIDALKAQLEQARATATRSTQRLARAEADYGIRAISLDKLEGERAAARVDSARVRELISQLKTARLPARDDQLRSQRQNTEALQAEYERAERQYRQLSVQAPGNGVVVDTFFTRGEWVAVGNPVVKMLVDRNTKVRFFVPEPRLSRLRVGDTVKLACDGCEPGYSATISHIAPEAEYTPPVIYSIEARSKLVFLVEARPDDAAARNLHPGLPVEVTP
ncbi:secretion protein HlyD [Burkholderia pyrrocinia]|uniref:Secretion protein HlyD n=1 Tax=Burkholderia pyrrocinia TaxID=60550 RepID=A0A2Z5N357_BURPY|nr:HlyD family efflux transporter periplasmic adaptor subunit [Burkholderia pyrrocinia]AXF23378.1 secretion protein HlyD [Burkholderia pyrrocinia]